MYPGLGVVDWQQYLDTIWDRGRRDRVREASRTLFLTSQRVIVLDETSRQTTSLPLNDIEDVSIVSPPPGKPTSGSIPEAMIRVVFHADDPDIVWKQQARQVGWATTTGDAEVFVEMLRQHMPDKLSPARDESANLSAYAWTTPSFEADQPERGHLSLTSDGLDFDGLVIPWSDLQSASFREGGQDHSVGPAPWASESARTLFQAGGPVELVLLLRENRPIVGFGLRVQGIGAAKAVWVDDLMGHGVAVIEDGPPVEDK
jgi:hypothetical protein